MVSPRHLNAASYCSIPSIPKAESDLLTGREAPVMAFGVSFPSSESGVKVEYAVDHLLWTQEYGPAD